MRTPTADTRLFQFQIQTAIVVVCLPLALESVGQVQLMLFFSMGFNAGMAFSNALDGFRLDKIERKKARDE